MMPFKLIPILRLILITQLLSTSLVSSQTPVSAGSSAITTSNCSADENVDGKISLTWQKVLLYTGVITLGIATYVFVGTQND
ncbi:MAG: hypothetical protein EBZ47_01270 [Chlamydiae bacterium]|nr:hypothetical protein [Chlamydiota bacterium]